VIVSADDVGDPEIEIVRDRRELVRRRAVRAEKGCAIPPETHGAFGVALRSTAGERALGGLDIERASLALTHRTFVERHSEPREIAEDRDLPTLDRPRGIGVVDAQHERAAPRLGEATVSDRGQRIPEMERARRARSEADANGHFGDFMGSDPWGLTPALKRRL